MKSIPSTNRLSICNFSRRSLCLLALSLAALSPSLQAQDKPPLKIVVGFPPGGSADILARMVADALRGFTLAQMVTPPPSSSDDVRRRPIAVQVATR